MKGFISTNLDFLGFSASFLCAIHCALLPFVMTVGLMGGLSWLANPIIENGFILMSIILASTSLYPSFKNKHHNWNALAIAAIGFGLLLVSRIVGHGSRIELVTVVIGGLLIAAAHYWNWQLLKKNCNCQEFSKIPSPDFQTSNSKLQAPNSKFQAPNSKLQIPNSKLQASNSELQASNSELQILK